VQRKPVVTGSWLVMRSAMTATLPTAMDAAAHVQLKSGTRAQCWVPAAAHLAAKYAATASTLATKPVMMATLHRGMGARTSVPWSAALFVMSHGPMAVFRSVETEFVLMMRRATTATLPMTTVVAAPVIPPCLDGSAIPRWHVKKQAVNSVQQANTSLMVCVRIARQARTCPLRAAPPHWTAFNVRQVSTPTAL